MGKKNENDIVFTEEDLVNDDIVFTEEDLIDNKEIPTVSLTEEEATSGLQTEPEGVSTLKDTYKKGAELNSRALLGTYDQRPQKEVFELQETLRPEYKQERKFTEQQLKDIAIQTNFSYPERLRNSFIQGLSPFISEASRNIGIMAKKIEDELPKVNITRGLFTDDKGNVQFNEKKSEDYATYQFADWLDKTVKDYAPTDSEMQKSIAGQLTQGAGSLAGFVLAARTGRALNLGKLGSAGLTAATGAAINGGMEYKQAKEMTEDANTLGEQEFVIKYGGDEKLYQTYVDLQGKDPDKVGYDVFQGAALIGSAEAWPVASFFKRLDKFTGGAGKKYIGNSIGKLVENIESNRLGRMALGGVQEGAQEAISQFLTNANANEIYDKSREYLDGVFESGNIGGILGLTLNAFIGGGRKAARLNPDKADEINAAVEHAEKLASKLNGVDDEAFYKAEESPKVVKLKEEQQDLTADISSLPQEQKSIVENRIEEINREIEESKKEEIASEKNDAVKEAKIKNLEGTIASLDKGIEGASEATKKVFESQKNKLVEQLNAIKNEKQEKTEGSRQDVLTPSQENAGVEQSTPVVEQAKGEEVGSGVGGDVDLRENPIVVNMSLPFNEGVNTGLVKNSKGAVYHDRNSAKLEKLGYSKEQIDNLSQTELNEILAKNIENPNVAASAKLPIAEEQTTTQEFLNQASKEGGRFAELATALKKFFGINEVETTIVKGLKNFFGGKYDGDYANKQIRIDEKAKNKLQTFLHEAIHKVTVDKLLQFERGDYSKLSKQDIDALQNLTRIFNESKIKIHEFLGGGKGDRTKGYYGFTNVHEFISEAFANPEFQHLLKNLPTEGKNPTIFKQFLDAVAKFLGLKDASILNDIFHHTENLREQSLPTQKAKAEQPLKETLTEKDEVKTESAKTPSEEKTGVVSDLEINKKDIALNTEFLGKINGKKIGSAIIKKEDGYYYHLDKELVKIPNQKKAEKAFTESKKLEEDLSKKNNIENETNEKPSIKDSEKVTEEVGGGVKSDTGEGNTRAEKNKKTDLSRLEGLKSKLKDAKQKANDIRSTSGVAEDAFEKAKKQAQADREVLNAYVDLAKYYISEGINDITTFAKEIGVAIDDTLREAWKKAGGTDDRKERRFAKQIVGAEDLQQEVKEGLSEDAKTYVPKTNAVSQKEALAIIEAKGEQETLDMIKDTNNGMKPSVRVFIGENLIKRYNKTDIKKAVETAEFLSEYATELGQGVQAFQPFSALTPEGQLLYVQKEVKRIREKQIEKAKPKIDRAAAEMRGANKEAIAEVLNVVDENISKAKDGTLAKKSVRAKQKKDLISALRKEYFQTLNDASRIAQLAVDKRTIQLAKLVLEDVADDFKAFSKQIMSALGKEIFPHLKSIYLDAGGKKAIGDVDKEVARAIKELDIDVKELVTKHYTEYDAAKKSLTDKLVKDAGMTQEDAEALSKQIQDEFEKVADKKKKQLLKRKLQNKVVNKKRNQELYEKLIELSNLGAFSDKEFTKAYAEKAGFANITEEQAKKIIDLANKIQEAPEGMQKFRATEDLLKYQENIKGVNWGEVAQSVWYANVLSGYSTQVVNTVANIYNTATLLGVASVKNPFRTPILAKALVNGWVRGIYDAADVLKTGYSPIRGKVEIPNILERVSFKGGKFNPYNYAKYVQRIMNAADTFAYEGLKEMRAYEMAAQEARKKGMSTISKETWQYVNEKMFNTKERIEDARAQAKDEGFTGIDYKRRVFEILEQSRPPEMVEDSKHYAARGTFNYQPEGTIGMATNWVNQLTDAVEIKGVRPLKFIVPFTRIIGNVTNNALDYTPYGFTRAAKGSIGIEGYSKRSKTAYRKFTPEQRREAIIKASLGTVMMAALYALTQPDDEGKSEVEITGSGTGDFKKDYELKQTGWQPYSLRIGDTWYSYKETPFVFSLSLLGNYRDNIKYKGASEEEALDSFAYSASSTANLLSDMTFLGSATDFVSSLSSGDANKLGTYLKTKGRSTLKGFVVPNLYTQVAKEVEIANNQALKDPKTTVEYLMQDIPVARNSQNDKINSLGEPVLPDTDRLTSEREKDPVWNYIVENKAWIGKPNQKASFIVDGDIERPMNDDEYYEFIKLSGKYIREGVEELMKEDLEKSEIKKAVNRIKENSRRLAKEELFSKNIN